MLAKRFLLALIPLLAFFNLLGCQPEEKITHVTRPRLNDMKRLLAAIIPPPDHPEVNKTWVFKVVGPESEIEPLLEPFNKFLEKVTFANPDVPSWKLPEGWTEKKEEGKKLRYATIWCGPQGKAPEISMSALVGEKASSIPDNLIRWRLQLGLKNVFGPADPELEDFMRPVKVGGLPAVVVDLIGPGGHANMAPQLEPEPPGPSFKYQTPPSWVGIPPTSQFYVLSFRAEDNNVAINVSEMPGKSGGLVENVNRWRGQVQLGKVDDAQINTLPEIAIGNAQGKLVDLTGPQGQRILGAILIREKSSLFFKMTGPSDLVEKQKEAFETFLKSVTSDG